MRRSVSPLRALAVIGATVAAALVLSGTAAHAEGAVVTHPFAADSGDSCRLGSTSGTLTWISRGPLPFYQVDVAGSLIDRPTLNDPSTCSDPRYSSAMFTSYRGATVIDREQVRVDNGQLQFRLTLAPTITVITPVDRVVVQVCRHAPPGTWLPDYCGKAVEYRAPITVWP